MDYLYQIIKLKETYSHTFVLRTLQFFNNFSHCLTRIDHFQFFLKTTGFLKRINSHINDFYYLFFFDYFFFLPLLNGFSHGLGVIRGYLCLHYSIPVF